MLEIRGLQTSGIRPLFTEATDFHSLETLLYELSSAIYSARVRERPSPVIPAYDPNARSFWEVGDTDRAISATGAT